MTPLPVLMHNDNGSIGTWASEVRARDASRTVRHDVEVEHTTSLSDAYGAPLHAIRDCFTKCPTTAPANLC